MKYKRDNKKIEEFHHGVTRSYTELNRGRRFRTRNSVKLQAVRRTAVLRGYFFILCFLSSLAVTLYAQETPAEAEEPTLKEGQIAADMPVETQSEESRIAVSEEDISAKEGLSPSEIQRIELEIKTSTLPELAAWSRTLGLSEGGTRAELSRRIRGFFELSEPQEDADENRKIITIESSQTTEYFTIEVVDEDYARLKGDVRISLKDKDSEHKIKAGEILFNRTRNILTARGGVEYRKEKEDTTEIFRGESITVNIDNWSSIFLDGNSERKRTSEETAYLFTGAVITRDNDEDVMIINNAKISNAYNKEALWSISASKLWLLPGSDFWIFNALLKVGEIPVLYIPVFFFPADEVVFHPVAGYRSREGAFIQTTTYILGRPTANPADMSSLTTILGKANDMEKERQGLFLRSTGKKMRNPDTTSLKAMIDYYTNLGIHLGLDLSLPRKGILNPLDLSLGVGFTRTLTQIDGNYNPYAPNFDGTFDWNHSNFFSSSVPFRYRMKTQSSVNGKYGSISWNFPFYSDPYVDKDFLNRSENMDWLNMIQQGAAIDAGTVSEFDIGSYQWQINTRLNPSFPTLSPYVSSVSLSNLSMTLAFKTIRDNDIFNKNNDHPGRFFFAPDKYTIYSVSGSVSGTPLTIGGENQAAASNADTAVMEIDDPLKNIGIPRSPWPEKEDEAETKSTAEQLIPPVLSQRFELPRVGNAKFSIDYQLSPTSSTELQFMSGYDRWKSYDLVDWSEVQSILSSFGGNGNINFRMDHSAGLYSNAVTFSANGTWREYSFLNEEAEAYRTPQTSDGDKDESKIQEAKRQQYSQTNYSTSYTYNGTVRPLYDNPIFGQSNLQYTFRGTLVRSRRYTNGDSPELEPQWGTWEKEKTSEDILGLSSHRLSANLAANILEKQQNITFSADLPPLDGLISTNATFRVWISETNANIQFKNPEMIDNEPNNDWKTDPFNLRETLRFGKIGTLSYYMVMDPEEDNEITTITSSLSLWDFSASFSAVKMKKYEFIPDNHDNPALGGRWEQQADEPTLIPRDLTLSYVRSFSNIEIIKNRMNFSLNLNSRLYFDLQRHTSSNFQFTIGFTLGITNFLNLSLSATSENAVIFRYFKNTPGMENLTAMYADGDQNNVFLDLIDSFNFGDDAKRRRSGFKMKRFNLSATHFLGDWKATLDIAMSPFLNNTMSPPKYEINADISFLVQWSAIPEIKSDIKYEKKTEKWTVK